MNPKPNRLIRIVLTGMTAPNPWKSDGQIDSTVDRSQWQTVLAAADRSEVLKLAGELGERYQCRAMRPAVSGLGMLQLQESVSLDGFFLGEFTLSTAAVELTDSAGNSVLGGASIMVDDENLALSLAILDAVLFHRWEGTDDIEAILRDGLAVLEQVRQERSAILASTTVDFSTLDQE